MPAKCREIFRSPSHPYEHYEHAITPVAAYIASYALIKDTKHYPATYMDWLLRRANDELEVAHKTSDLPYINREELLSHLVADALIMILPAIDEIRKKQG